VARYTVIFDANVLYPQAVRDCLMSLAVTGLFRAHWTQMIHEEWVKNLHEKAGIDEHRLWQVTEVMNRAVLDAKLPAASFEGIIETLTLPDAKDRHVLAAAIAAKADAIITFNLKDFPLNTLEQYNIEAIHPDDFIHAQIDLSSKSLGIILQAFKEQRARLINPPYTPEQFISMLKRAQLINTATAIEEHIQLI